MFVIEILFIRTFRYRLIFYLVEYLLLNFMNKTRLSKKFHGKV